MKILAWFEEFVRCMEHGSSSCLGVLALFAWPHAFQNSLSAKRDAESELNSMFGGGIEVMDGSILYAPHVFEGFKLVLFFSLYLRNSCHVLACEREEFARFADSIELVALARERKEQYDKINITGYSQFFDPVEWKTGIRASLYQNSNATVSTSGSGRVKTLTDFLDQIFSCERRKVGILIQSGPTNSGKSHSAHSWISLLYQLNGVFIGSSISSDFQRVSHLGVRHLRVVEEYKHNIIGDFHHLESNGKQLFSNNAVVPTRVSVAMLNCDKVAYSLDEEANLMALDSKNPRTKKEIQSRVAQVRSRLYVLDWTNAENSQFLAMSNKFRITCNRMSRVINNAIKLIRENRGESDLHHRVDVGMNEIILRWDLSTVSSMRYSQILQAYGDLGAWGAALNRIFSCLTKSYMYLSKYDIGTFAAKLDTLENLYVSKTRVPLSDEIIKCAELMIDEKTTFEGDLLDFSTGIADRVAKSVITSPVYSIMSYAGTECQMGKF